MYRIHRERDPEENRERARERERKGGRVELAVCPGRQRENGVSWRFMDHWRGGIVCVPLCE